MSQSLNFRTYGTRGNPALLLIHPLGGDLEFWGECVAQWESEFFCIACDLLSAGASPLPSQPPTVADQVDALSRLAEEVELSMVIPVGTAVGGMIAVAFAAARQRLVCGLIVSNPGLRVTPSARRMLEERIALVERHGMAGIVPKVVELAFSGMAHDARYATYLKRFGAQDPAKYVAAMRGILDADVGPFLPRLTAKTLIVSGGRDALTPAGDAQSLQKAVRDSELVVIEDASHFVPLQAPDRFSGLVADFVHETRH